MCGVRRDSDHWGKCRTARHQSLELVEHAAEVDIRRLRVLTDMAAVPASGDRRGDARLMAAGRSDLAATRGKRKRATDLTHPVHRKASDPSPEQLLRNQRQIVERERTLLRHTVDHVEDDFSRDLPDRPRRRHCEQRVKQRNRRLSSQDQERTPTRVRMLDPPDLASGYQGSALIAAIAPWNAHGSRSDAGERS
jgi:hypothetical protein